MSKRINYNLDLLINFCNDNNIIISKDYSNQKMNRETIIRGKCLTNDCENIFEKTFRRLLEVNGYCKECCIKNANEKKKNTFLEKYGVENPLKSKEIREKIKATCLHP